MHHWMLCYLCVNNLEALSIPVCSLYFHFVIESEMERRDIKCFFMDCIIFNPLFLQDDEELIYQFM
jgi:hypothetical protein